MLEVSPDCGTPEPENAYAISSKPEARNHVVRDRVFRSLLLTFLAGGSVAGVYLANEKPSEPKPKVISKHELPANVLNHQQAVHGVDLFASELLARIRGLNGISGGDIKPTVIIEQYLVGSPVSAIGSAQAYLFTIKGLPDATGAAVDPRGISEMVLQQHIISSGKQTAYTFEFAAGDWTITETSNTSPAEQFTTYPMLLPGSTPITTIASLKLAEAGSDQLVRQAENELFNPPLAPTPSQPTPLAA